jgi:hypothetical protein
MTFKFSRHNILATSTLGSLVAAAAVTGASAETYSAGATSDPGPRDPAQGAINPYDWQSLPTDLPIWNINEVCSRQAPRCHLARGLQTVNVSNHRRGSYTGDCARPEIIWQCR